MDSCVKVSVLNNNEENELEEQCDDNNISKGEETFEQKEQIGTNPTCGMELDNRNTDNNIVENQFIDLSVEKKGSGDNNAKENNGELKQDKHRKKTSESETEIIERNNKKKVVIQGKVFPDRCFDETKTVECDNGKPF